MYEDWDKRPADLSQARIVADLRERLQSIRKAQFEVLIPPPIPGLGQAGGFQMMVEDRTGVGLGALEKAAQQILLAAEKEPGLRGVMTTFNSKSPQLQLRIDRTMAESLGVTMNDVFQTLQTYLGSTYVNLFNKFNQSFQVRVQADADYRRRLDDIGNLYVANRSSQMVPLGTLVDVRRVLGSELITHYNLYPAAPLVGGPAPGYSSGEALKIMERLASANLPQNMGYNWTGLSYQEKLIGNQAYFIFALSIALVFLVLAAQYESWSNPAAVIITVPMALVGVIVALIIRDLPSDLYTQIGLVLMIALAAKNAILIVEFARELKAEGMSTADAAVEATRRRFRPILDDFHRLHPRRRAAHDGHRCGSGEPAIPRHRSFRRHARLHALGDPLRLGLLYCDGRFQRTAAGTKGNRKRAPRKSRCPRPPSDHVNRCAPLLCASVLSDWLDPDL